MQKQPEIMKTLTNNITFLNLYRKRVFNKINDFIKKGRSNNTKLGGRLGQRIFVTLLYRILLFYIKKVRQGRQVGQNLHILRYVLFVPFVIKNCVNLYCKFHATPLSSVHRLTFLRHFIVCFLLSMHTLHITSDIHFFS